LGSRLILGDSHRGQWRNGEYNAGYAVVIWLPLGRVLDEIFSDHVGVEFRDWRQHGASRGGTRRVNGWIADALERPVEA